MKTFKNYIVMALLLIIMPCFLVFAGCNYNSIGVVSIVKTNTNGLVDTYTITYSNGETSTFDIVNGKDGTDSSITIDDIYNKYIEEYGDISYKEFLELYLNIDSNTDLSSVIQQSLLSSMKVYSEFTVTTSSGFGPYITETKEVSISSGSAVIYEIDSNYAYIVTNYHVVFEQNANTDNGSKIARSIHGYLYGSEDYPVATSTTQNGYTVYDYGNYAIELEFVGGSISNDIAVLKAPINSILKINPNVKAVKIASNYHVGDTAIAIGNPEGEGISATQGIVSVDNEYITLQIDSTVRSYRSIRIDTAIYPGNSGGGLFNKDGELIGITNAGDDEDQNINYAVPIQIVDAIYNNVIYYANDDDINTNGVYAIKLGITVETENSKYVYDSQEGCGEIVEDVIISEIVNDSIASKLGLQNNDKIISIIINNNEFAINRSFNIHDILLTIREDDSLQIKYSRNSEESTTSTYVVASDDISIVD